MTLAAPGAAGSLGASKNIVISTTAPGVVSINRADSNPTAAGSVDFAVTFSVNVTGVNAADFVLSGSGLSGTGSRE